MDLLDGSPWYHLVEAEDNSLEQGDVLFAFRYYIPREYVQPSSETGAVAPVVVVRTDALVLTPSCDLAHGKMDHVLLCPHWDFEEHVKNPASGLKASSKKEIESRRVPRYCLLAPSSIEGGPEMKLRLADFGRVLSIPRPLIDAHVGRLAPRLRMRSPYREHVAQAFGACYTRIGLPRRATEVVVPLSVSASTSGSGFT